MKERLLGGFFLALGSFLSYLCIYDPLAAAARHEEKVSVSMKGSFLCPLAIGLGLLYRALGPKATALMGTREKPRPLAYVICGVLVALGAGVYFWLKAQLESAGYMFSVSVWDGAACVSLRAMQSISWAVLAANLCNRIERTSIRRATKPIPTVAPCRVQLA